MKKEAEIKVMPESLNDEEYCRKLILKKLKLKDRSNIHLKLLKRSIDARGKNPVYVLRYEAFIEEEPLSEIKFVDTLQKVRPGKRVIIIGAGPAGYFAALSLIKAGIQPIVLERGKDVRSRRKDLRAIQQFSLVNPHSNYCFGEGGAGTYSDGKLYTRSYKRGSIKEILNILVEHGAKTDILVDAHPHIGSNKLPILVENIRKTIIDLGGEIHFNTWVVDFLLKNRTIHAAVDQEGREWNGDAYILATGHSARDVYAMLHKKGITIERKPFALGVRIEHPQPLIDEIQYGMSERSEHLPASSYRMACQVDERGVFSFCMCPGGLIVPAATSPGEIVVNGMSLSRRDSPFANSGFVTSIDNDEMEAKGYGDVFGHLRFQQEVEQIFFQNGDGSQKGPAQLLTDFVEGKVSKTLPECSYIPGIYPAPIHALLPDFVYKRLKDAMLIFGHSMNGFYTSEAVAVAVESRTSAPVRIPRNALTFQHNNAIGLYPCGEGAGYAGGILSAAMDGQNVANAIAKNLVKK